ncbi:hypothetical protein MKW98_011879 [Papaver atlanticum]|uniref:Uncharacterized protein n=1 Tax=Papaver atlanticum TaxID=357466 RepID=A0AAD4T5Q5_9MAGN|nr:hypothetical protein MKW98_011879 [Papaver atlanticum]
MKTDVHEVKTQWPELVGKLGDAAKETIQNENPGLREVAYFIDRVRVWVDEANVVIRVPKVG